MAEFREIDHARSWRRGNQNWIVCGTKISVMELNICRFTGVDDPKFLENARCCQMSYVETYESKEYMRAAASGDALCGSPMPVLSVQSLIFLVTRSSSQMGFSSTLSLALVFRMSTVSYK